MSDNKTYGGITSMKTVDASNYDANAAEFREQLATGKYELDKSFLSPSGAYVLYETGHNHHEAELEAAMALADAGINVTRQEKIKLNLLTLSMLIQARLNSLRENWPLNN